MKYVLLTLLVVLAGLAGIFGDPDLRARIMGRMQGQDIPAPAYESAFKLRTPWQPGDTATGNFLAASFAQSMRDWNQANAFLSRLNKTMQSDPGMRTRMMLLALGAGDYAKAIGYAREIGGEKPDAAKAVNPAATTDASNEESAGIGDQNPLALAELVLVSTALRDGRVDAAQTHINNLGQSPFAIFVSPVLQAWINAANKKPVSIDIQKISLMQAIHCALAAEWGGQKAVADTIFGAVLQTKPARQPLMAAAAYYTRTDQLPLAKEALTAILVEDAKDAEATKAMEMLGAGQKPTFPDAFSYHLQSIGNGTGQAMRDFALLLAGDQAYDSALLFAQLSRLIRNDVPGIGMVLGDILSGQQRWEEAISAYKSVPESDPVYQDAQIRAAETFASMDQVDKAVRALTTLTDDHGWAKAAFALGEVNRRDQQYAKAVEAYDRAIVLSRGNVPDDLWSIYYVRAMAYDQMGDWKRAEADLKAALKFRPDNPLVLNYLAYSWADKGMNLDESLKMITGALMRTPTDPYIIDSLGWVYYRMGRIDEAAEALERAISLKPYDATINDHLGDVYAKAGRTLEAQYQWQRAIDYADPKEDAKVIADAKKKLKEVAQ